MRQLSGGCRPPKYLTDVCPSNIWGVYIPKIFNGCVSVKYLGGLNPQNIHNPGQRATPAARLPAVGAAALLLGGAGEVGPAVRVTPPWSRWGRRCPRASAPGRRPLRPLVGGRKGQRPPRPIAVSRDLPLGESQDSPHNATHMLFHFRIF